MNNINSTGFKSLQPENNDTIILPSTLTMNSCTSHTNLKKRKTDDDE